MSNLNRFLRINKLFSFYGNLLTDKQQRAVKLYYYHDLSLGEIATKQDISRQAVYDNLKRSEAILEEYETKLALVKHYNKVEVELEKMTEMINDLKEDGLTEKADKLALILDKLKIYQEGELA